MAENWRVSDVSNLVVGLWILRLVLGIPFLWWCKGGPKRGEKRDIKNYLDKRKKAFERAGIPAGFNGPSHNAHKEELARVARTIPCEMGVRQGRKKNSRGC